MLTDLSLWSVGLCDGSGFGLRHTPFDLFYNFDQQGYPRPWRVWWDVLRVSALQLTGIKMNLNLILLRKYNSSYNNKSVVKKKTQIRVNNIFVIRHENGLHQVRWFVMVRALTRRQDWIYFIEFLSIYTSRKYNLHFLKLCVSLCMEATNTRTPVSVCCLLSVSVSVSAWQRCHYRLIQLWINHPFH